MWERCIDTSVRVAAPPRRVWAALTDFQQIGEWNPFIRSISGVPERGARLSVHIEPRGLRGMRFHPVVLAFSPERELRWRGSLVIPGLFDGEHYFLLEPVGTDATHFIHGERFSGILVPLLLRGGLLEATRNGFVAMNEALKRVVEEVSAYEDTPTQPNGSVHIVEERPEHWTAVDRLTREAFGGDYEADLADRLRREELVIGAFVALERGEVIGHVMLSDLPTEVDGRKVKAACLAPLSVNSLYRQQGIGARLLDRGIRALRELGYEAIFVLGDTRYYVRFGFSSARARKIDCPFPGEAFMAMELVSGALDGKKGAVKYPKAFRLDA